MGVQPDSLIQKDRETQFIQNMGAFMRRDFAAFDGSMRSDVVMELPGSSWLAGNHQGYEGVSRCVLGLRQVLTSDANRITFLHQGDQMLVSHDIMVSGPEHDVDMTLRVKVRYDEIGKVEAISVEPDDPALFDHVLNTVPRNQASV